MPSENLLPNYYKSPEDAAKVASQIRRSSFLVCNEDNNWRVLIMNDKSKLYNDLKELNLPNLDGYVFINDNYGAIQRIKPQLNSENILNFARILTEYSGVNNLLNKNIPDIAQRLKKMITVVEEKVENIIVEQPLKSRSGEYKLQSKEFYLYYKRFTPNNLRIEQIVDEEFKDFYLIFNINDKNVVSILEPVFRKSKEPINKAFESINSKGFQMKLQLKPRILNRIKDQMFEKERPEYLFEIRNPLGKFVLNDINNYNLIDLNYL